MLVDTSDDGPVLGLHLGMAGRIALEAPDDKPLWDRFTVEFEDGTRFALRDRRRLGRAVLNPDFGHVGPDAALVGREEFRTRIGRGRAPVKARLLDQGAISGVGNLLADEALWRARLSPRRPTRDLETEELDRLRRSVTTGRPFGGDVWAAQTAKRLGIPLVSRPRGRPRKREKMN